MQNQINDTKRKTLTNHKALKKLLSVVKELEKPQLTKVLEKLIANQESLNRINQALWEKIYLRDHQIKEILSYIKDGKSPETPYSKVWDKFCKKYERAF